MNLSKELDGDFSVSKDWQMILLSDLLGPSRISLFDAFLNSSVRANSIGIRHRSANGPPLTSHIRSSFGRAPECSFQ